MLFDFLLDMGNYDERKVARDEREGVWILDTCRCSDSDQPYETAYCHKKLNDGKFVIVEMYDTKELAAAGHKCWLKKARAWEKKPPKKLRDVSSAGIAKLCDVFAGSDDWRERR